MVDHKIIKIEYKRARAYATKVIKTKKRESYHRFVESINKYVSMQFLWNKVRIMKNPHNRIYWNKWLLGDRRKVIQVLRIATMWIDVMSNPGQRLLRNSFASLPRWPHALEHRLGSKFPQLLYPTHRGAIRTSSDNCASTLKYKPQAFWLPSFFSRSHEVITRGFLSAPIDIYSDRASSPSVPCSYPKFGAAFPVYQQGAR